ncbi:serine/threonine-protein kinase [Mycobacterium sp. UM_CSW]|uniref:serine/threonine-protein kinase n=1 Tax=Mycobacterium sp. UM_CSW TaxID=1370119 RepID=UPI0004029610|nr:serine/threonine-protein kinase [Mycobacterium sp. UM_CSW]
MSLEAGQVFAGYTIVRVLGAGGMGQVYLAAHPRLPRQDALKVLPAELTGDPEFRGRFLREAELAAGLSHPHIVTIHDRGEEDGQFWISMDYVAGNDAGRLLREHHPGGMPLEDVVAIITAVGSALDYAHGRGLLHRDVKPANILLTDPDGQARRVYLADFGLARHIDDATGLTATNMTVGTVAYVAPEQLKGERVDGRADQYALACTAFHLLTGSAPYVDSNPAVVISQHINAAPPSIGARRPELAALDPVFATAMAKEPSHRFAGCREFADQLARQLGPGATQPGDIPFPDTQPRIDATMPAIRPRRRPRALVGALLGIALLVVAGGVFAAVKLLRHSESGHTAATSPATTPGNTAAATPNTGPFTGVYRVRFSQGTTLEGVPGQGAAPETDTYAVRSACGPNGCRATAQRVSGELRLASNAVFDEVDGRWVAVTIGSDKCRDAPAEVWQVLTLQPQPDGTFAGEYRGASANACNEKRTVTFTRSGDVDINKLPDPNALPPRVGSPAQALHGRYHLVRKFKARIAPQQTDQAVVTDCLRTGERCMSYFHSKTIDTPLVFEGGTWTLHVEHDDNDPGCGGAVYARATGQYALPQPPQDPIPQLIGHDHLDESSGRADCQWSVDFDETYTRTGD